VSFKIKQNLWKTPSQARKDWHDMKTAAETFDTSKTNKIALGISFLLFWDKVASSVDVI